MKNNNSLLFLNEASSGAIENCMIIKIADGISEYDLLLNSIDWNQ